MPTTLALAIAFALLFPRLAGPPARAAEIGVEELLQRHLAACGGDRWKAARALELTGTATFFSVPAPFRMIRLRPQSYRFERTVLGNEVVSAFDGKNAWWNNPNMGMDWPVPVPLPEAEILRREADFDGPLVNHASDGQRIELIGRGDLDGEEGWELKVTWPDGAEERWFLHPETYLAIARVSPDADYGEPHEKTTHFSDYREVDGLVLAHRAEMEYGTRYEVLEIESARVNPDLGEPDFRMPPPEGMPPLASLAGEWDLVIATRAYPQAPWEENRARSTVTPLLGGRMLEERFSWVPHGVPIDVIRTLSYDRVRKIYRITQIDSLAGRQEILEGVLEDGRLGATDTGGAAAGGVPEQAQRNRLSLLEIEPDSFRIIQETSSDGGGSWTETTRCTYTRR